MCVCECVSVYISECMGVVCVCVSVSVHAVVCVMLYCFESLFFAWYIIYVVCVCMCVCVGSVRLCVYVREYKCAHV